MGIVRMRNPMETGAELESLREKAKRCETLMAQILTSPYPWTLVGYALMRWCVQMMILGKTPFYFNDIEYMSRVKEYKNERVDLEGAFDNFKAMPSAGNAAVLYRMLTCYWGYSEQQVIETQNVLDYFMQCFGAVHGRGSGLESFIADDVTPVAHTQFK